MNISITITDNVITKSIDIMVDDSQKLKTTFKVLSENMSELVGLSEIKMVRLKESGRIIETDCSYKDAHIFNGAELLVMR